MIRYLYDRPVYIIDRVFPRSKSGLESSPSIHIAEFFAGYLAKNMTADRVTAYRKHRLEESAAPATINVELAALRRMFALALRAKRVTEAPYIGTPTVQNARQGFFEARGFRAVLERLPAYVQPVVRFGYLSGWRLRKILGLQWKQVDALQRRAGASSERAHEGSLQIGPSSSSELVQFSVSGSHGDASKSR